MLRGLYSGILYRLPGDISCLEDAGATEYASQRYHVTVYEAAVLDGMIGDSGISSRSLVLLTSPASFSGYSVGHV